MNHNHCSELLGDLSAYLDGEASDALCQEIERHLESCDNCRVVVDTLRRTVELVRSQPEPGLPDGARERLYVALDLAELLDHSG